MVNAVNMKAKIVLCALALPVYGAIHESLASVPRGWVEARTDVEQDLAMQLSVSLNYRNIDQLEISLRNVSDPTSHHYGEYLSRSAVNEMFGPSTASVDAVTSWLREAGARNIRQKSSDLSFTVSTGEANAMLNTTFKVFTNGDVQKLRATQYSIPDALAEHIDFISPTTYFSTIQAEAVIPSKADTKPSRRQLKPSCETTFPQPRRNGTILQVPVVGPQCLKQLYNMTEYSANPSSGSSVAFSSFAGYTALFSDLAQFEEVWGLPKSNFSILASINNGSISQDPDTAIADEADLDVQTLVGLVDGLPVGEYSTGGAGPLIPDALFPNNTYNYNEPFIEYYQYLLQQSQTDLPWVISTSYADIENTVPERYARRVCNVIGMLGLRGRTIVHSSGDSGVGQVCQNNVSPNQPQFEPQFPATCPYVTTVGGTQSYNPEIAWTNSSGGFSFYFTQPWYQENAIKQYFFSNRGFPDLSAHSEDPYYGVVIYNETTFALGTSAATPVVAAVFTLLNDARFRAGQPAVGFANPWLYSISEHGINDITSGVVAGCFGPFYAPAGGYYVNASFIPWATWNATEGWDPVTGLGTPNFGKMLDLLPTKKG